MIEQKARPRFSVLIPYFNKEETLNELRQQIEVIQQACVAKGWLAEFIVFDDASTPGSFARLLHELKALPGVHIHHHGKNCGKGKTLRDAAVLARYETLIWLDADAAYTTDDVLRLMVDAGTHLQAVVVADRTLAEQSGASGLRMWASRVFRGIAKSLLALPIGDIQAGLKALPREWFVSREWRNNRFALDVEVLRVARREGIELRSVPVSEVQFRGQSSVSTWRAALELLGELAHPVLNIWMGGALLLVLLTNLRAFSLRSSVPWDARDEMWFYFRWLGSALRERSFGDFIPNIASGYPIGANIQSGTYNPLYLAFAAAFPDTALSINLLYLTLQFLICVTAYLIAHSYNFSRPTGFFFALSLVACGFVTGHASHFSYLSSFLGGLLIWLALRFSLRGHSWLAAGTAFLGTFHLGTSGYPAILVFAVQVFAVFGVAGFVRFPQRRRPILFLLMGVGVGALLAAPSLMHFLNQLKFSARSQGITVEEVLSGSLPARGLVNFVWPYLGMGQDIPNAVDPTMNRFHLLLLSFPLILVALWDKPLRQKAWMYLGFGLLFLILALGKNAVLPLREFLAQHVFIYRVGRFPSGEHRGFALALLALVSAMGFEFVLKRWPRCTKFLVLVVVLDFSAVMASTLGLRFTRLPQDLQGHVARFQIEYRGEEGEKLLNAARGCPFDSRLEFDQRETPPNRFSWDGYTNLQASTYLTEREVHRWAICGAGRLWAYSARAAIPYVLNIYSPSRIAFSVRPEWIPADALLLWADVNDGLWTLTVNGRPTEFAKPAPAALRLIAIPRSEVTAPVRIEMVYRGPLSRIWR